MPRPRPTERFDQLVEAATRAFLANGGFKRTSIQDVAREMGVAKGTVYLYVTSKDALFDVCLRRADQRGLPVPALPIPAPEPGSTLGHVRELMDRTALFDPMRDVLLEKPSSPIEEELGALVDALYDILSRNRVAIRLIGSSAQDMPELSELWYSRARGELLRHLAGYFSRRATSGHLRALPDPVCAARFFTETIHWFAVSRHFDPEPDALDDTFAKETVKTAILRTFLPVGVT